MRECSDTEKDDAGRTTLGPPTDGLRQLEPESQPKQPIQSSSVWRLPGKNISVSILLRRLLFLRLRFLPLFLVLLLAASASRAHASCAHKPDMQSRAARFSSARRKFASQARKSLSLFSQAIANATEVCGVEGKGYEWRREYASCDAPMEARRARPVTSNSNLVPNTPVSSLHSRASRKLNKAQRLWLRRCFIGPGRTS